jgi:hypothetical protein
MPRLAQRRSASWALLAPHPVRDPELSCNSVSTVTIAANWISEARRDDRITVSDVAHR